ncbi:MAG: hypothetical protein ACLQAT_20085 [Candidatus Binataceae bacterium]
MEIGRKIVAAIAGGNFVSTACRLAGISTATLDKWLKRGEKGEQPFKDFAQAYRDAESECESVLVEKWKDAAPEDWRAAKELLAKRWPERWSDHAARLAVLGPNYAGNTQVTLGSFQINIHLEDDPEWQRQWDEQVRQRTAALEIEAAGRATKI